MYCMVPFRIVLMGYACVCVCVCVRVLCVCVCVCDLYTQRLHDGKVLIAVRLLDLLWSSM